MPRAAWVAMLATTLVASGCGQPATSPSAATPVPTSSPSHMPWPTEQLAPLSPGRYAISPPFDFAITLDIPDAWHTLHLHGEFTDFGWFAGSAADGVPERIIAFGHPTTVRGEDDVPAAGLTADEVADLFRSRTDLETGEPQAFRLDDRDGLWLEVLAPAFDTRLFSGPDGDGLGIGPDKAVRVVIIPLVDGELLLVTVHADGDDLAATWQAALPILASVDLPA
jgi:hypothetical protein